MGAGRQVAPDVSETVERAELAQRLYGAILALPEPTRDAVLLRHVDDLPPREIAARLEVPVATVKKRIERGLAQLRQELESEYGSDGQWAVAFLPLAGWDAINPAAKSVLGFVGAATALVAAIGVAHALRGSGPLDREPVQGGRLARAEAAETPSVELDHVDTGGGPRTSDAPPRDPAAGADDDTAALQADTPSGLELLVVDANGAPLPDVAFEWSGPRRGDALRRGLRLEDPGVLIIRTDASGILASEDIAQSAEVFGALQPVSRRMVVLDVGRDAGGRDVAVVVPAVRLAGVVIDPVTKEPIAGASYAVAATASALTTLDLRLAANYRDGTWGSHSGENASRTDEFGRFELDRVPTHPDFALQVVRKGDSGVKSLAVPPGDDLAMVIEAFRERPAAVEPRVFGRVFRHDGSPCAGAIVYLGQDWVRADETGEFKHGAPAGGGALIATVRGGGFVVGPEPDWSQARTEAGAGPYDLVLPERMASLYGQVVDPEGRPLRGLHVFLVDGTSMGRSSRVFERAVEPTPGGYTVEVAATDGRGVFGFRRVQDRPYLVRVVDPRTRSVQTYPDVPTSTPLERLVFDPRAASRTVRGSIVDHFARPVADAEVAISICTLDGRGFSHSMRGNRTRSDATGRFELEGVPRRGVEVDVWMPSAEGGSIAKWSSPAEDVEDEVRIVLDLDCEIVVRSSRPRESLDRIHWENVNGDVLSIRTISSGVIHHRSVVPRRDNGTFPLCVVPQSATTLVLRRGDDILERVPVGPDASQRTTLDV